MEARAEGLELVFSRALLIILVLFSFPNRIKVEMP